MQQAFRPAATGAANPAIIVVARPRAAFGDALRALFPSLLVAGAVAAGFALIVAGLLSRTITRPLRELVAGARRFAHGEYRTRVPVAGPGEVAELGGAFNEMAGEIERARDSEQAFLADISHELRTPLTSIQGFAQAIAEGEAAGEAAPPAAKIIQRESRRLIRMVEGLLEVAKLQAGGPELGPRARRGGGARDERGRRARGAGAGGRREPGRRRPAPCPRCAAIPTGSRSSSRTSSTTR